MSPGNDHLNTFSQSLLNLKNFTGKVLATTALSSHIKSAVDTQNDSSFKDIWEDQTRAEKKILVSERQGPERSRAEIQEKTDQKSHETKSVTHSQRNDVEVSENKARPTHKETPDTGDSNETIDAENKTKSSDEQNDVATQSVDDEQDVREPVITDPPKKALSETQEASPEAALNDPGVGPAISESLKVLISGKELPQDPSGKPAAETEGTVNTGHLNTTAGNVEIPASVKPAADGQVVTQITTESSATSSQLGPPAPVAELVMPGTVTPSKQNSGASPTNFSGIGVADINVSDVNVSGVSEQPTRNNLQVKIPSLDSIDRQVDTKSELSAKVELATTKIAEAGVSAAKENTIINGQAPGLDSSKIVGPADVDGARSLGLSKGVEQANIIQTAPVQPTSVSSETLQLAKNLAAQSQIEKAAGAAATELSKSTSSSSSGADAKINAVTNGGLGTNSQSAIASARPLTSVPVPFQGNNQQFFNAVAERVMWMASQNIQAAELHLDPADLGPIQVRVAVNHDQQASVNFVSHTAGVREQLDLNVMRLREMFENEGMALMDVDVSDSSQQQYAEEDEKQLSNIAEAGNDNEELADGSRRTNVIEDIKLVDFYA